MSEEIEEALKSATQKLQQINEEIRKWGEARQQYLGRIQQLEELRAPKKLKKVDDGDQDVPDQAEASEPDEVTDDEPAGGEFEEKPKRRRRGRRTK